MARIIAVLSMCLVFFIFLKSDGCDCNETQICIQIDQSQCPNTNFSSTSLELDAQIRTIMYIDPTGKFPPSGVKTSTNWVEQETLSNPTHHLGTSTSTSVGTFKYVDGWQINYGILSRDSYRRYTYAEIFEWRWGYKPSQSELNAMTDQQAKDWFVLRHRVWRTSLFSSNYWDNPRDVNTNSETIRKFCITKEFNEIKISGRIRFANGNSCELEKVDLKRSNYGNCDGQKEQLMRIKPNCSECN